MSSRLQNFAAVISQALVSGAASAYPGAKTKSADGSLGSGAFRTAEVNGG